MPGGGGGGGGILPGAGGAIITNEIMNLIAYCSEGAGEGVVVELKDSQSEQVGLDLASSVQLEAFH
jgi:hypothetical protein